MPYKHLQSVLLYSNSCILTRPRCYIQNAYAKFRLVYTAFTYQLFCGQFALKTRIIELNIFNFLWNRDLLHFALQRLKLLSFRHQVLQLIKRSFVYQEVNIRFNPTCNGLLCVSIFRQLEAFFFCFLFSFGVTIAALDSFVFCRPWLYNSWFSVYYLLVLF